LQILQDASELHLGLIDFATYEQRMNERPGTSTGLEAAEARLPGKRRCAYSLPCCSHPSIGGGGGRKGRQNCLTPYPARRVRS